MGPAGQQAGDTAVAGVIARPPLLFLAALLLGFVSDRLLSLSFAVPGGEPVHWVFAAFLILIGLGLVAAGIGNFSRAATPVPTNEPTRALVTTGIHGWTRNPIYLGMFLVYGGIGIAARSPWILVLTLPLQSRSATASSCARRRIWNGASATPIGTTRLACAAGCSCRERRPRGADSTRSEAEVRSGLLVLGALAVVLASCARIPTPEEANDAVLTLRAYESSAWAVGIALIWADVVLPIPQTAVIAALGIVYGTLLGGLLGSLGLISGGLLGYVLMLTSARRFVQRFAGPQSLHKMESLFEQGGAWAIVLTRSLPYSVPEAMVFSRRTCAHAHQEIHGGADHRQRAHVVRLCRHRRRLGRPANPGPRRELCPSRPVAARRGLSHAASSHGKKCQHWSSFSERFPCSPSRDLCCWVSAGVAHTRRREHVSAAATEHRSWRTSQPSACSSLRS